MLIAIILVISILPILSRTIQGGPAVDENLDVDNHDLTYTNWDDRTGTTPYLDSADDDESHTGSYIHEAKNGGLDEGWFDFENTSETGTGFSVVLSIRGSSDDVNDGVDVYVDWTGSGSGSLETFIEFSNIYYAYYHYDFSGTYSATQINSLRIYLSSNMVQGGDDIYVDHMNITIKRDATEPPYVEFTIKDDGNNTRDGDWDSEPFRYSSSITASGQDILSTDWFYGSGNTTYIFNFTVTWGDLVGQTKGLWMTGGTNQSIETIDCADGAWRIYVYYTQNINDKVSGYESGNASDQYGNITVDGLSLSADYWFKIELDIQEDVLVDFYDPCRGDITRYAEGT